MKQVTALELISVGIYCLWVEKQLLYPYSILACAFFSVGTLTYSPQKIFNLVPLFKSYYTLNFAFPENLGSSLMTGI